MEINISATICCTIYFNTEYFSCLIAPPLVSLRCITLVYNSKILPYSPKILVKYVDDIFAINSVEITLNLLNGLNVLLLTVENNLQLSTKQIVYQTQIGTQKRQLKIEYLMFTHNKYLLKFPHQNENKRLIRKCSRKQ